MTLDLPAFEREMQTALARLDHLPPPGREVVSFGLPDAPEYELLELLRAIEPREVDFGITETVTEALQKARADFSAFLEQINRDLWLFATVETWDDSVLKASTRLHWGGNLLTVISADLAPGVFSGHAEDLHWNWMTRLLRLRMLSTVTAAAGKIALTMSTPGAGLLVLPVAYQYLTRLSEQWQELTQIQGTPQANTLSDRHAQP